MTEKHDEWTHEPLPYRVVLRAALKSDDAPTRFEKRVVAYSVVEAIFQALIETTGNAPGDAKYDVEVVEPDMMAYLGSAVRVIYRETV